MSRSLKMRAPLRTPVFDDAGNVSRTWALYFNAIENAISSGLPGQTDDGWNMVPSLPQTGGTFTATPDILLGLNQEIILPGALPSQVTIANPLHIPGAVAFTIMLVQGANGGVTLAWGAAYKNTPDLSGFISPSQRIFLDFSARDAATIYFRGAWSA